MRRGLGLRTTHRSAVPVAVLVAATLSASCGRAKLETTPGATSPKFAATSYYNEGSTVYLVADTRASRLAGPDENRFLPLFVAVENKTKDLWRVNRESFVLELPDRTSLPLATYEEFDRDYPRGRADLRAGEPFVRTLSMTFPQRMDNGPFSWLPLDFFPIRGSGTFPRDEVQIIAAQLALGYVYFRLPPDAPTEGTFKLLFRPGGSDPTFIVDFEPYKSPRPPKASKTGQR